MDHELFCLIALTFCLILISFELYVYQLRHQICDLTIGPAVLAESYTCLLHALAKADDLVKISISVCWGGGKSGLVQRFCGQV